MYCSPNVCYSRSGFHGHGLFTCCDAYRGTVLTEYCGEVIGRLLVELRDEWYQQEGFDSVYIFTVSPSFAIDATFIGNYGRFINHACRSNCHS